jgi:hypothetical protein
MVATASCCMSMPQLLDAQPVLQTLQALLTPSSPGATTGGYPGGTLYPLAACKGGADACILLSLFGSSPMLSTAEMVKG